MRLEERLLDHISDIEFALHPPADLDPSQQGEVAPIAFEQLPERRSVPCPGQVQQPENVLAFPVVTSHPDVLSERSVTESFDSRREFFQGILVSPRFMSCWAGSDCPPEQDPETVCYHRGRQRQSAGRPERTPGF